MDYTHKRSLESVSFSSLPDHHIISNAAADVDDNDDETQGPRGPIFGF